MDGLIRAIFGDTHPLLAVATHSLGRTRLDHGLAAEAEVTLRHALELGSRVFPKGHVNLAIFASNHGRTWRRSAASPTGPASPAR